MIQSWYVQYGCGLRAPPGWRNFDASPTLRIQRLPLAGRLFRRNPYPEFPPNVEYGDIVKGLPLPEAFCVGLYCSHVLEHLSLSDFRLALRNSYRLLIAGGVFRLVVPDLEFLVQSYLSTAGQTGCINFMEQTGLGRMTRSRGIAGFLREWIGNSGHLWMWDFKGLAAELKDAGFRGIRRARPGDSADFRFLDVEDSRRWENCLGVECVR